MPKPDMLAFFEIADISTYNAENNNETFLSDTTNITEVNKFNIRSRRLNCTYFITYFQVNYADLVPK